MAQGTQARVKNGTNSTILQGKAVSIIGFDNTEFVVLIGLSSFNNQDSLPSMGVTLEDIGSNETGSVKTIGIISGPDTTSVSPGQDVFVGNNGDLIFENPLESGDPRIAQYMGKVLTSGSPGQIYVLPSSLSKSVTHQELANILPDDHHDEDHAFRHSVDGPDTLNHGTLSGLLVDTHSQYIKVDGYRGFSGPFDAGQDVTVESLILNSEIEFSDTSTLTSSPTETFMASNVNHTQSANSIRFYPISGLLYETTNEDSVGFKIYKSSIFKRLRTRTTTNTLNSTIAPTGVSVSENGSGSLSGDFYYVVTSVDPYGGETTESLEDWISVVDKEIRISWTGNAAYKYRVYKGTSSGVYDEYFEVSGTTIYDDNGDSGTEGEPPISSSINKAVLVFRKNGEDTITIPLNTQNAEFEELTTEVTVSSSDVFNYLLWTGGTSGTITTRIYQIDLIST